MSAWTDLADCVRRAYPLGTVDRWEPWQVSRKPFWSVCAPAVKFLAPMVRALAVKMLFCGVPECVSDSVREVGMQSQDPSKLFQVTWNRWANWATLCPPPFPLLRPLWLSKCTETDGATIHMHCQPQLPNLGTTSLHGHCNLISSSQSVVLHELAHCLACSACGSPMHGAWFPLRCAGPNIRSSSRVVLSTKTLNPEPYTLHPTPYTLHPKQSSS
jgi:hypothetical protein